MSKLICVECGQAFDLLAETTLDANLGRNRAIGQFHLIHLVGTGAFGEVWKAKDSELDRFVAVKIPHAKKLVGQSAEQFLREARAAAQLKHPNIVPVFEVGRHDQVLFIVSQFIEGVSLEDFLSAKKLSVREAAAIMVTIADAIDYAHAAGVIHRDLKPSNVLLDGNCKPYIVDFGLAKRDTGEVTVTIDGTILGTPLYMSPEQARGESHSVDRRSDIYSLGVILFRLLTNELPFRGNRPMLLHQIVHAEPPSLRSLASSIPRDIETITLKCLQKDREKRYSNAAELVQDLQCFLSGNPIKARPVGAFEKAVRWCQRKPLVASLIAGLSLSLTLGLISVSILWQRARFSANQASASSVQATKEAARAVAQEKLTKQYLYVAHMNMVQDAWDGGLVSRASELLARQSPELRTFPWFYYNRMVKTTRAATTFEHDGIVTRIAFSPTSSQLAICGNEGQMAVWDLATRSRLKNFQVDEGRLTALTTFTSDGNFLLWSGRDGKLSFFETANYGSVGPTRMTSIPWGVPLSPRGVHFAFSNQQGNLVIGEANKNSDRSFDKPQGIHWLTFNIDGTLLLVAHGDREFSLVSVSDGSVVCTSQIRAAIGTMAVAPNGKWIASGSATGDVTLWKLENLELVQTTNFHNGGTRELAFSSDSQTLVSMGLSDEQLAFWKPSDTGLAKKNAVHSGSVQLLSSIPGTKLFAATISEDNLIHVWDGESTQQIETYPGNENLIYGLAVSPNGRYVAAGGRDRKVQLLDRQAAATNLSIPANDDWLWTTCFADSGSMLITAGGDRTIRIWDSSTGKELGRLIDPNLAAEGQIAHSSSVQFVLLMPDGDTLASSSRDSSIKLWSIAKQKLLACFPNGHQGTVNSLASPAKGNLLYSVGDDGKVVEWDTASRERKRVVTTIDSAGWAIACTPDGNQIAVGGVNKMIDIWDNVTSRRLTQLRGHQAEVTSLHYSPDGRMLASTSSDRTAQLHSTADIELLPAGTSVPSIMFRGHSGDATCAAFSPDGRTLATCGSDRTIRLWDLATGEAVGLLNGHTNHIHCITFDSTGTRLASASWDKTARIWRAPRDD